MNRLLLPTLLTTILVQPLIGEAQQVCHSESEIPSSTPTSRFTDHGNGTVTDSQTGLMWARCVAGLAGADCEAGASKVHTWQKALEYAAASTHAGYVDWRLPNVTEFASIFEQQCSVPSINIAVFPNTSPVGFWSASPLSLSPGFDSRGAWHVHFYSGTFFPSTRDAGAHIRLVRAGQ